MTMRLTFLVIFLTFFCCKSEKTTVNRSFKSVDVQSILQDSSLSIRALDYHDNVLYYGSADHVGAYVLTSDLSSSFKDSSATKKHYKHVLNYQGHPLHFRAIEVVNDVVYALSIAHPARLYKFTSYKLQPKLVYEELHSKVFYDAMAFWNSKEGIAIGDPTEDCMSIIVTRDAGETWSKIPCDLLPKCLEGEAAFAASDTNIAIVNEHTWVATGGKASRVLYSPDKGKTWRVYNTPIIQGKPTTGLYSIAFYDAQTGFGIGGDYTRPNDSLFNKIITHDGGKTWHVTANANRPGYRSCVQYVPNTKGQGLVALGFKGIDYSADAGKTWQSLSNEGFYTLRFINDSIAFAGGKGRLSKLTFKAY